MALAGLACALGILVAACGPVVQRSSVPTHHHSGLSKRLTWIISASALAAMASPSELSRWLAGGRLLEIVSPGGQLAAGIPATMTISAGSYQAASSVVVGGGLGVGALIYDPEHWQFTPLAEQENPFAAEKLVVAKAASRPHLTVVLAPALDLTSVLPASPGSKASAAYLQLALAAEAGRALAGGQVPGFVELQAQSLELDPSAYAAFVHAAVAQVHSVAASLPVLAGLSTAPPVGTPSLKQLLADVSETEGELAGYWLNVPRPGAHCPSCGAFDPTLAASLLNAIASRR
jgi:hypothetical protein